MLSNYFSHFIGSLVHIPLPQPLAKLTINTFASFYKINVADATKPLESFSCIGDFFVRDIRPELRPIAEGLVSPVDGTLRDAGAIKNGTIPQVKGKNYSVKDFLDGASFAENFIGGSFINLYLSPSDCHHIFAPCAGKIKEIKHIRGRLWPVNDWSVKNVDNLFVTNERVVIYYESEFGEVALVMVGATNVGKIKVHARGVFSKAEKIGTFHMGSSVVLLFQKNFNLENRIRAVKYGESLQ